MYTRKLLSKEQLSRVSRLVAGSQWARSASEDSVYLEAHQTNSEMVECQAKAEIQSIVMGAIEKDEGFRDLVLPERSTRIIVSRTEIGQGFKAHHDMPANGDFSTTVFLSDPATYQGGELTMLLGGEEREFALEPGHALTYSTGIPHCVKEVTQGTRYAVAFWTTSLIRDSNLREIVADLRKVKKLLPRDYGYDLTTIENNPHFLIQGVENKILRHFVQK